MMQENEELKEKLNELKFILEKTNFEKNKAAEYGLAVLEERENLEENLESFKKKEKLLKLRVSELETRNRKLQNDLSCCRINLENHIETNLSESQLISEKKLEDSEKRSMEYNKSFEINTSKMKFEESIQNLTTEHTKSINELKESLKESNDQYTRYRSLYENSNKCVEDLQSTVLSLQTHLQQAKKVCEKEECIKMENNSLKDQIEILGNELSTKNLKNQALNEELNEMKKILFEMRLKNKSNTLFAENKSSEELDQTIQVKCNADNNISSHDGDASHISSQVPYQLILNEYQNFLSHLFQEQIANRDITCILSRFGSELLVLHEELINLLSDCSSFIEPIEPISPISDINEKCLQQNIFELFSHCRRSVSHLNIFLLAYKNNLIDSSIKTIIENSIIPKFEAPLDERLPLISNTPIVVEKVIKDESRLKLMRGMIAALKDCQEFKINQLNKSLADEKLFRSAEMEHKNKQITDLNQKLQDSLAMQETLSETLDALTKDKLILLQHMGSLVKQKVNLQEKLEDYELAKERLRHLKF